MWEKIVLNLLSNAFKHTFEGGVSVSLRCDGAFFELEVKDTGTGIPAEELPRIFERFGRVEGARSRTHEGTGIGLALVQELVKLHGGAVEAESEEGRGSAFRVRIPAGKAHLPAERIGAGRALAPTSVGADAFIEEAQGWLRAAPAQSAPGKKRRRIVWADDNADMREYVRGLLAPHYDVEAVADGAEALAAVRRERPELVITDAMMPNIDGIELLRRLRADPGTATLPVLVLSARAGEEARIEGLQAGADEYLYKPFSARELLARVGSLLRVADSERSLREADRRKDEFLATLAHELRNPLAPLRSALELLQRTQAPRELDAVRGIMRRQVDHLVRLVDDLLEVSRISRGVLELRRELVPVAAVMRNAAESSRPLIESKGHDLELIFPAEPLWLDGDPVRLAQIVSNLLNNAAKYTDPGGRIVLAARREPGGAAIEVGDNGRGIAPDALPRLFEMFSRERPGGEEGLGIGLALSRKLAELHGGTLEAQSDGPGLGASFTLRLPLAAPPPAVAASAPAGKVAPLRARVLVVDDNRDAAETLAMLLRALGAEVRTAFDGPSALRLVSSYAPEVALLDIGMEDMDGYELARAIRQGSQKPPALIALTGWGQEADRLRAKDAGFDHHLVKPADIGTLQSLFSSL
jgi:signal transduction histidine kinase